MRIFMYILIIAFLISHAAINENVKKLFMRTFYTTTDNFTML